MEINAIIQVEVKFEYFGQIAVILLRFKCNY